MAFIRIRTIKGLRYKYLETRWREAGRVRSRSQYLGPEGRSRVGDGDGNGGGDGFLRRQFTGAGGVDWDAIEKEQLEAIKAQDKARDDKLKELHDKFGLVLGPANPVPIDKPPTGVGVAAAEPAHVPEPASADLVPEPPAAAAVSEQTASCF